MTNIDSIADQVWDFNVTNRTIHIYEYKALLSSECQGQNRIYYPHFIVRGKWLRFSLNKIFQVIGLYDVDSSEVSHLRLFLAKLLQEKDATG
jgi:DNA-binding transcriptional MerR regulator